MNTKTRAKLRFPSMLLALLVALVGGMALMASPAHAAGTPDGCSFNRWNVDIGVNPGAAGEGDVITFSIFASNVGANGCDVQNVTVTFTDPGGDATVLLSPANYYAIGTAEFFVGDVDYTADGADAVAGFWTGTVSWSGTLLQGGGVAFAGNKQVQVQQLQPDVTVEKTADNSPINAGETASFTITVENLGPGVAKDVELDDTLPAGTWSLGNSNDEADCSIVGQVLNCEFGDLDEDETRTVVVSRPTDQNSCGTLNNTAYVSASNEDPTKLDNNDDSASIVINCPDIGVEKTADNSPINAGETASFTITVTGYGPGTASGGTLSDTLPGDGWVIDSETGGIDCAINAGVLECDLPDLEKDDQASVTISRATAEDECSPIVNTATVSMTGDTNANNNSSTDTITVICETLIWQGETAWAANGNTPGSLKYNTGRGGNWATYVKFDGNKTTTLFAGQTIDVGTVQFTDNGNNTVTIVITLSGDWEFEADITNLAVQGYEKAPKGNPAPGQFEYKKSCDAESNTCSITVAKAKYYGVHVNVGQYVPE